MDSLAPKPGSAEEARAFSRIQANFPDIYKDVFSDPRAARTVVVVPSMSLPESELAKIPGVIHYEERMLCLLMLLRLPRTQLVYVTSIPLDPSVVDYYLHLLPGIPGMHARRRLKLLAAGDASLRPLSEKILSDPRMLAELKAAIDYPEAAHMSCFNSSPLERTLAVQLGIPMYACDPSLANLGSKSNSRAIFRSVGLDIPDGFENLRDRGDLIEAIVSLHGRNPETGKVVIKLNEGFSGEGNAIVALDTLNGTASPRAEAEKLVTREMEFAAPDEHWESYEAKLEEMGGIAEVLIEHEDLRSPSVQLRIDPLGATQLVSTHDQVLAGETHQVFLGCTFPARRSYRTDLHEAGITVAKALKTHGVLGRFGVDFVSVTGDAGWRHYAIEINLRKGGTTLPYLMLEFLTDGHYESETGDFYTPTWDKRSYYATDNLVDEAYRGLSPSELIDAAVYEDLHYHATAQEGLVFHLLGAVTDHGKIGMVSIASSRKKARRQYRKAVAALGSYPPLQGYH